jgi:multidrug transporter EmrE-like cation transporter
LLTAFTVAAIPSVVLLVLRRRKVLPIEMVFGFLMGASNILQTHFVLKSLQYYDGFIVFPVVSAGSLMLTAIVATRMLGERLNRRSRIGIAIAIVALVLLNYLP